MATDSVHQIELSNSRSNPAIPLTYRIRGIPLDYGSIQAIGLLRTLPAFTQPTIEIHSLAIEAGKQSKTATATFVPEPDEWKSGKSEWEYSPVHPATNAPVHLAIDRHFLGITTLRSVDNASAHKTDCIAVVGLGGHAFGSFKQRGESHMWLRDTLPNDLPGARIMIYGYDSTVHKSHSFQDLEDLASAFRNSLELNLVKRSLDRPHPLPLIFIAHSLGGLVIKQALIQLGERDKNNRLMKSVYGVLFFGCPNRGLEVSSLIAMAKGKPNESFISSLGNNQLLRNQCRDFSKAFDSRDSEIICFYETLQSPSAVFEDQSWKMNGPLVTFVNDYSATHGRPWENQAHHIQGLHRTHSDLVKFSRLDPDYDLVLKALLDFSSKAQTRIPNRFPPSANDFAKPKEYSHEEKACIQSFAYQGMHTRHVTIRLPLSNTSTWYQKTSQFRDWIGAENFENYQGLLWIKGIPGSGKSVLMKDMTNYLHKTLESCIILSFFFNARGLATDRHFISLLRSLVHQLVQRSPYMMSKVLSDYQQKRDTLKPGWNWLEEELKAYIIQALEISTNKPVLIVIDALDECIEEEAREVVSFVESLIQTASSKIPRVQLRICLASRHYPEISVSKCYELVVQQHNSEDITKYVESVLKSRTKEEKDLGVEVINKASGIFLWAVLACKKLSETKDRGGTIKKLQGVLRTIPNDLGQLFSQCLGSISSENHEASFSLIQWVMFAQRPMQLEEIQYAIWFSLDNSHGSQAFFQQSDEYLDDHEQLLLSIRNLSAGLIEVVKETSGTSDRYFSTGKRSPIIVLQFIHESVREFMLSDNSLLSLSSNLVTNLTGQSHDRLCKACIKYLNIDDLRFYTYDHKTRKNFKGSEIKKLRSCFPFVDYAVRMCFVHAVLAERAGRDQGCLILHFHRYKNLGTLPWTFLYDILVSSGHDYYGPQTGLLHIASEYGLWSVVRRMLDGGENVNLEGEGDFGFPLILASVNGHNAVVKLLLEKGADMEVKSRYKETALHTAARNGHDAIVKLLLEKGADIEAKDKDGQTALHIAVFYGHEAIIKLLLEKGADIEAKDITGQTALHTAARNDHNAIIKLLLEKGADIEVKDIIGQTALYTAARHGHNTIIKLLLEKGADIEAKDETGQTALHTAARHGHNTIIKLLLEKGADIEAKDETGQTALHPAARNGHDTIIKLFLEKGADIEAKDRIGQTALHMAAWNGHDTIIKLFLEKGADIEAKDRIGQTALHMAAWNGRGAIVKLLESFSPS